MQGLRIPNLICLGTGSALIAVISQRLFVMTVEDISAEIIHLYGKYQESLSLNDMFVKFVLKEDISDEIVYF